MAKKVDAQIVEVTPELAKKWLGSNTLNRSVRERQVNSFAGAIDRGEWMLNGDAIRFDINGRLLDGQHRLLALIEANKSIQTLVVHGLDPTAQETIDAGARRSLADVLKLRGETSAPLLASVVRLHWRYSRAPEDMLNRMNMPTTQQLLAHLESNEHMRPATRRATNVLSSLRGLGSVYGTGIAIGMELAENEEDLDFFLERLITGTELSATSPIYHLRQFLLRQVERRDKVQQEVVLAHWIKAWNAYRDGRQMELLIFRSGGKSSEKFPTAH